MNVYVVLKHSHQNYPNENTIVCICLKENLAKEVVEDEEKAQANFSKKYEFWYEEHELLIGDLKVVENYEESVILA